MVGYLLKSCSVRSSDVIRLTQSHLQLLFTTLAVVRSRSELGFLYTNVVQSLMCGRVVLACPFVSSQIYVQNYTRVKNGNKKKLEYFLASIEGLIYQFRFLHPSAVQAYTYTYNVNCCFRSRKSFFIILPGTTPPSSHPVIVFIRSTLHREMYMIPRKI